MLYVVVGPPAAGKSTWVLEQARSMDVVIDYDRLAVALAGRGGDDHHHGPEVKAVTKAARTAAISEAMRQAGRVDVFLIHSNPGRHRLAEYAAAGARVVMVDPGRDVVLSRIGRERPRVMFRVVDEWYAANPVQGAPPPPSVRTRATRSW